MKCELCSADVEIEIIFQTYDYEVAGYKCQSCGHEATSEDVE